MTALVEARDVVKRFGSVIAVDGMSLEVFPGEVVGLLGANGAGKTTLIRVLLGLLEPNSGAVSLFGGLPTRRSLRNVGYVPQGLGLYTDLTVAENVAFRARLFAVPVPALASDLVPAADVVVSRLPLGLQRRVAFFAAGVHRPRLLLLDEPTSGVGPLGRARLWETIRRSAEDGAGVLVSTHHIDEAEECDRLLMMGAGHAVARGSVADIIGDLLAVEVRTAGWQTALAVLAEAGMAVSLDGTSLRIPGGDPQAVRRILTGSGVDATISQRPATLEETFVSLAP